MTIVGNMIAPEFMDWFLARTAVSGQDRGALCKPSGATICWSRSGPAPHPRLLRRGGEDERVRLSRRATRAAIVAGGAALFFALGLLAAPRARRPRASR